MHITFALKGMAFSAALAVLIFFLKVICPIDTGCLVDPFLYILFSPLALFQVFGLTNIVDTSHEPFAILAFWALFGFIVGALLTPYLARPKKVSVREGELEI